MRELYLIDQQSINSHSDDRDECMDAHTSKEANKTLEIEIPNMKKTQNVSNLKNKPVRRSAAYFSASASASALGWPRTCITTKPTRMHSEPTMVHGVSTSP